MSVSRARPGSGSTALRSGRGFVQCFPFEIEVLLEQAERILRAGQELPPQLRLKLQEVTARTDFISRSSGERILLFKSHGLIEAPKRGTTPKFDEVEQQALVMLAKGFATQPERQQLNTVIRQLADQYSRKNRPYLDELTNLRDQVLRLPLQQPEPDPQI